ncbi:hypothetical protein [Polaribacter sp. L3A8]|uniref:hypothetical protein n=1 Tax=Polaribacter sp. L3A8 TaxID=2686361 RepID=UPI00131AEA36|nr:hypothetical protein [Polaribacter sp. L3A8]
MHKKLEADLISLAHSILQLKNKEDVFALKEISKEIYEKLSLLAFVEEYVNTTPALDETKEELVSKVEIGLELQASKEVVLVDVEVIDKTEEVEVVEEQVKEEQISLPTAETIKQETVEEVVIEQVVVAVKEEVKVVVDEIIEQPFAELEEIIFAEPEAIEVEEVIKQEVSKVLSLEEELEDTISVDELATLFDIPAPKSLNDRLTTNIQIGLNDRIAFVKNLFDGSQEDFNRVVSQLNTYGTEKEANKFISKMVKPDYDWSNQQELEARFMEIIERRFA